MKEGRKKGKKNKSFLVDEKFQLESQMFMNEHITYL